jgi:hypothetical protein
VGLLGFLAFGFYLLTSGFWLPRHPRHILFNLVKSQPVAAVLPPAIAGTAAFKVL